MRRVIGVSLSIVMLVAPGTATAGEPGYEDVVFRVTLSGPVPAADPFGVAIECNLPCVTEDYWLVCGPPDETYILPTCDEATYEFTAHIEAGLVLEYALARWPGGFSGPLEEHLHGSFVVQKGRQVITLGYEYPGAETPALPDTAMPLP